MQWGTGGAARREGRCRTNLRWGRGRMECAWAGRNGGQTHGGDLRTIFERAGVFANVCLGGWE